MTQSDQAAPLPTCDPVPADSLGSGAAGIALLHVERARTGTELWDIAHEWVSAMTRSAVTAAPDVASLYRGVPAVAFVLRSAGLRGYASALATLDVHIGTLTRYRLSRAHERIDRGQLPALGESDLISGLTGIGAYLLHCDHDDGELFREVLAYLVRLTEPVHTDGGIVPGWWCGGSPSDQPAYRWPGGHGNLGLAHGIAGPLALLSTAMRRGVIVAGRAEAIERILAFFDRWRCGSGWRAWWPGRITRAEWRSGIVAQRGPQRPSWCYGAPGLVRAQQLAALALNDPQRQQQAEDAFAGCVTDEHQLAQLVDGTLCHGWAGLVHATWRAAADAGEDSELVAALPQLYARFDEHLDRHGPPGDTGLLEGEAGVRLVQHTTAANEPSTTGWDTCLLLAG